MVLNDLESKCAFGTIYPERTPGKIRYHNTEDDKVRYGSLGAVSVTSKLDVLLLLD